jgi:alcohol dehydrogenase
MQAYVLRRYGGSDAMELTDVPRPNPAPGEILVRVRTAGLNPVDWKIREGKLRVVQRYRLPVVAGNECAGTVESLGEGVTRFRAGERVYARLEKARLGAFAEYTCVPATLAARIPDPLDFEKAAAVPLAGLTALQGLRDELAVAPGARIFIPGGAGGVGTLAIQIAKALGAQVATTASPRGEALVKRLGADVIIDYTQRRFDEELHDYDGAFDLVGGDTLARTFRVVKRGSTVVSIAGLPEPTTARKDLNGSAALAALFWLASSKSRAQARLHGVRYRYLFMHPSGSDLEQLGRMIDERKVDPVVDRVFPFAEIGAAFAYLEQGRAKGKVVVRMDMAA